ncbi:unnamed protein product [Symbiodinium necroappetens]|uniref:Ubiquitin-fold modifier-conjugating enzyme 1 n=1 Tax=Symbiodinium necroappetens TaxID=1628268 RepID=A0A813BWG6_9DINO|nr:unnamed protein product [Symbiodinium necroappetens]
MLVWPLRVQTGGNLGIAPPTCEAEQLESWGRLRRLAEWHEVMLYDEKTRAAVQKIPLLSVKAGPRDEQWAERLKEELMALIRYVQNNKENDSDWFQILSNEDGTKWTGTCWYVHNLLKYEFKLQFEIPAGYPAVPIELELPELDGKTPKMYRGGKICLDIHFAPLWRTNVPKFGIAHALSLALGPWLAAEIPYLIEAGVVSHKTGSAESERRAAATQYWLAMDNASHDWEAWAHRYGAWPHQLEAFRKALSQNSILNMPTGSGKTLVACMLLDALGVPSVFVVNSRALVAQQTEYLRRHSLQNFSVASTPQAEVFVATGEVIRIALETGQIVAQQLRCVIFDEAHHAVGRHPYAEVLRRLREGCCPARILGLTASFLHGNADPERRLEVLEERFGAQAFSPQVHPTLSHSERRFTAVPWFEAAGDEAASAAAYAGYARRLDVLVEDLAKELEFNWELQSSLSREKGRLRGVLESLGPAAYQPFVQDSLVEVVQAKLSSKLQFVDGDAGDTMECLQRALVLLPQCREVLARVNTVSDEVSGKFEALRQLLRRLLSGSTSDKILVFVERVSVAGPMARLLEASTGVEIAHVCGVQGMEEGLRQWNLQRFRTTCRVLVATTSLEEGLDVPDCRYVVRYDFFSSAKSHVQGAGRARHGEAEIFYFDNDPKMEEDRRRRIEDALSREAPMACSEREPQRPEAPAFSVLPSGTEGEEEGAGEGGEGIGHAWGEEKTLWDYRQNKSFRGMACACGALLHITSRAYGRGRKKKERSFSVQGAVVCPLSLSPIPELRQNGKRATGACSWRLEL